MTTEISKPEPCLRCGSDLPATATPRNELYFYTARVSWSPPKWESDVNQVPRGRLCETCTSTFVEWLRLPS